MSEPPISLKFHTDEGEDPMCWKCDHPDATEADYLTMVRGIIDSHGWFVQGVEKDRLRPPFAYTVGLTELGRPELLVTGMALRESARFLNGMGRLLVDQDAWEFVAGDRHRWPDGTAVEVVDVAEPTVHLVTACQVYGQSVRAVQLVHADDRGRWPWEIGFRGNQPVLGPRARERR